MEAGIVITIGVDGKNFSHTIRPRMDVPQYLSEYDLQNQAVNIVKQALFDLGLISSSPKNESRE